MSSQEPTTKQDHHCSCVLSRLSTKSTEIFFMSGKVLSSQFDITNVMAVHQTMAKLIANVTAFASR